MANYRWIWVPTLNFFGALIVLVEGLLHRDRPVVAVGAILMLTCLAFGALMYHAGERWL